MYLCIYVHMYTGAPPVHAYVHMQPRVHMHTYVHTGAGVVALVWPSAGTRARGLTEEALLALAAEQVSTYACARVAAYAYACVTHSLTHLLTCAPRRRCRAGDE